MLSVVRSKACRRCRGDLSLESDEYGTYIQCLQCGATYSEEEFRSTLDDARAKALKAKPAGNRQASH